MRGDDGHRTTSDPESLCLGLERRLETWAAPAWPPRLTVAFSGGLDSTVLLAALSRCSLRAPLRAAYVDHGLHHDSERWGAHCAAVAERLGVELVTQRVAVDRASGLGLEGAAREARYRALGALLAPNEWLLTAHHADDQLETLLLRLVRGSGVRGLRGVIAFGQFGVGYLARPLLGFTRVELAAAAEAWRLTWLEDPANREQRHDRNFLRSEVLPALRARWPAVARHAERLGAQMSDAEEILEAVAAADASALAVPWCLPRAVLAELDVARQRNLLRYLVRGAGLGIPSARKIDELRAAVLTAKGAPVVRWSSGEGRVFRGALHLLAPLPQPSPIDYTAQLARNGGWSGPEGRVALVRTHGPDGLPESWLDEDLTLRFRSGGERFRPRGRRHRHTLRHLFQENGIVPWMRARVPLVYRGEALVAVGDLWVTADADTAPASEPRWRVEWSHDSVVRAPE